MMELSNESIAIIGFLLGPVLRTMYDYFWKAQSDPDIVFDKKYWVSMALSMFIGVIAAVAQASLFLSNVPEGSELAIFLASFSEGFTVSHLVNAPVDYMRRKEEERVE